MTQASQSGARVHAFRHRLLLWFWLALLISTLTSLGFIAMLVARGDNVETAAQGVGISLTPKLLERTGIDSWKPMAAAFEREQKHPGEMYWIFFVKRLRFQYPPSALLVMKFFPLPLTVEVREKLGAPSLSAVLLTIAFSLGILLRATRSSGRPAPRLRWVFPAACAALISALGLTFYPLIKAHNLGQIQVYLCASVACALLAHVLNLRFIAGMCFGLCCLIKPQYALVLLWAGLRREFQLLAGCVTVLAIGTTFALREFGVDNHLQYVQVLRELSRHGESFWPNQSVNGLLHRFLLNGEPVKWLARELPPYHPVVYFATLMSSGALIAAALFWPADKSQRGTVVDLAVLLVAATMASPIAWEHHYGIFFPIFAAVVPLLASSKSSFVLLLVSYACISTELIRPELLLPGRWSGLLSSHIFTGGILLFGTLLASLRHPTQIANSAGAPVTSQAGPAQ